MFSGVWILVCVFVSLVQGGSFDPEKDLKGFDEAYFSEFSELYDLERFKTHTGDRMSEARLVEVRREWDQHRAEVEARILELREDSDAGFRYRINKHLAKDQVLRNHAFEVHGESQEVVLFVQKLAKANEQYGVRVDAEYRPYLEALLTRFRESYSKPLALSRSSRVPRYVLVVFSSRGVHNDYLRINYLGMACSSNYFANYYPKKGFAATFVTGTAAFRTPSKDLIRANLHELSHALFDAYSMESVSWNHGSWISAGLAIYLSSFEGRLSSGSFELGHTDRGVLKRQLDYVANKTDLFAVLSPTVRDLLMVRNANAMLGLARQRAQGRQMRLSRKTEADVEWLFNDAAFFLVHFLHHGNDGQYRRGFGEILRASLAGENDAETFSRILKIESLEALQAEFDAYRAGLIKDKIGAEATYPSMAVGRRGDSRAGGGEVVAKTEAPVIQLGEPSALASHGQMLDFASKGRVTEAIAKARAIGAPEEDLKFLEELKRLSDDVLDFYRRNPKRALAIKGEKNVAGKVVSFDDDKIVLKRSSGAVFEVERSMFGPDQMARLVLSRRFDFVSRPALAGALTLTGTPVGKAIRSAKFEGQTATDSLRRQAERWTGARKEWEAHGILAGLIQGHRQSESPSRLLETMDRLLGGLAETEIVVAKKDALLQLAGSLLERQYNLEIGGAGLFGVPGTLLADGRIELRYSFDIADEVEDFHEGKPAFMKERIDVFGPASDETGYSVEGGRVCLVEGAILTHFGVFEGDCLVEFSMVFTRYIDDEGLFDFYAGVLDDGDGSMGKMDGFAGINVINRKARKTLYSRNEPAPISYDRSYRVSLEHADDEFILRIDGEEIERRNDLGLSTGSVSFLVAGVETELCVDDILIRGRLAPSFFAEDQKAWIEKGLDGWR